MNKCPLGSKSRPKELGNFFRL